MATLLDANVLITLIVTDHVHHDAAEAWLAGTAGRFATCPITEGSLVRLLIREGQSAQTATAVVSAIAGDSRHEFWPDEVSYSAVSMTGVIGHRQVTDAYLAYLARTHNGRLASFNQGLAKLHDDIVDLIPT
ncbi:MULTISPECIES: TA system VapC family ribonuclease toxin [Protofrankia]|uniref:Ribonuclease VapC n=1 Tax=Candidatus Protofrankia datiscae TaxID=2716812 RepID=F8B5W6_9ACTN|nr:MULTISPECIES: TA system VapC family ribonuclease toxin [Protofrankia]AEH11108.1 PIN domain protein family protein [Candidatus Protofrankia datiscae]